MSDGALDGAPYRGLASFDEGDAHLFFGREEVTQRLAAAIADDADFHDLPLILVGASGAGKSSVLRAGLLSRLTGPAVVFEPTAEPLAALKTAQLYLSDTWPLNPQRPALIVDQFETLFTACRDEALRHAFVGELCELAESRAAHVVIALRADFYGHVIRYAEFANALEYRQVVLGPMTADDVTRAITEPARQASQNVEAGLVRLVLEDLTPHKDPASVRRMPRLTRTGHLTLTPAEGAYDPGALPLLSHAMLATWEKSRGGTLTVADYRATGGVRDAVARSAEAAYEGLSGKRKQSARPLFLRLVHVTDDMPPTRTTLALDELRDADRGAGHVLDVFVGERLVTVDTDSARITHDALLTGWPRLRGWIDAQQASLILAKAAAEAADVSSPSERTRHAASRGRRRGYRLTVAIAAVLVLLVGLTAGYAFRLRHDAASAQALSSSREAALVADRLRATDPALAAQLSAAGYGLARTQLAAESLLNATGSATAERINDTSGAVQSVAVSPDQRLLAAAGADGTLNLWNIAAPGHPALLDAITSPDGSRPVYAARFSPDGTLLAAAGAGGAVRLWNISDPAHPVPLPPLTGPAGSITSLAFSENGHIIAAGSSDGEAWLWTAGSTGQWVTAGRPLAGAAGAVNSVAIGVSGRVLAEDGADGKVRLWNLSAPGSPALAATLTGPAQPVTGLAFSHLNELAAASQDGKVWLWKTSYGPVTREVPATGKGSKGKKPAYVTTIAVQAVADGFLAGARNGVNAVAFSPDGAMIAAGTSDSSVLVWNLARRVLAVRIPAPQPVTSVAWDGGGQLAAGQADGTAVIWTLPAPELLTSNASTVVRYSPDGKTMAVGGSSVQLWDVASRSLIAARPQGGGVLVNGMAYSPAAPLLAVAYSDGTVAILDSRTLAAVGGPFLVSATGHAGSVAFSPGGTTLATGGGDGTLRLWSVASPAHPQLLATEQDSSAPVDAVAYAPNGQALAAASADGRTRLWNVATPASPVPDGGPLARAQGYPTGLAFAPGSTVLAISSANQTTQLWDVASPASATTIGAALTGPSGSAWATAISPDGTLLAVGSPDGTVRLWNIASPARPTLIATLTGPTGPVFSVAFSPAGTQVAATSDSGAVYTWDTNPADARAAICAGLGQPLTPAEWAAYMPGVPFETPCSGI